MKKIISLVVLSLFIFSFSSEVKAARSRRKERRPQIGAWFGPITPVYDTYGKVDAAVGGGGFFRMNTLMDDLRVGFDVSYQSFESTGVNEILLVPYYMNLVYRLPLKTPIQFQLKAGAGFSYIEIQPEGLSQRDPLGMFGFEVSFPVGRTFNVGMRLDYLYLHEKHLEGATQNGHIVNAGITVYFNL